MGSVPDLALFLRKPRLGATPNVRPVMKCEWNKLLAEATEKDVELKNDEVNEEEYYDDDSELEREIGTERENSAERETTDRAISNEKQEERPLNLCNKSHTIPVPGNKFLNSFDVLDLSAKKKRETKTSRKSDEWKKQSSCTNPTFESSQSSPNKCIINGSNKEKFNNKENVYNNNIQNSYSTPINKKCCINEQNEQDVENINIMKSCSKIEKQEKENLIFFSEKKVSSKGVLTEKLKGSKEDASKKLNFAANNEGPGLKKSNNPASSQSRSSEAISSQKFAVPATPRYKESSKILTINKKSYQILAPLGKGGSSKVYLVLNSEYELLAVKCVRLSDVSESTKNDYLNEIQHLMKMQHCKHVIKLYDHQYLSSQKILFAVMERGETDLSHFLKDKASSDEGISPELIMYYWTEMLMAVKSIHDNNIIHRDLKPANFLLVSGRLKLIDFGIASSIQTEQTSILMESQSGTFNYMSPETLQDLDFGNKTVLKIGRKTDVWSLGCILYYFLYKKTPYQDLVNPIHKLKAITDSNYNVPFPKIPGVPDILIDSCKRCLIHDVKKRASIEELLDFRNRPLFSLPQVLTKLKTVLSPEEFKKAEEALEDGCGSFA